MPTNKGIFKYLYLSKEVECLTQLKMTTNMHYSFRNDILSIHDKQMKRKEELLGTQTNWVGSTINIHHKDRPPNMNRHIKEKTIIPNIPFKGWLTARTTQTTLN